MQPVLHECAWWESFGEKQARKKDSSSSHIISLLACYFWWLAQKNEPQLIRNVRPRRLGGYVSWKFTLLLRHLFLVKRKVFSKLVP